RLLSEQPAAPLPDQPGVQRRAGRPGRRGWRQSASAAARRAGPGRFADLRPGGHAQPRGGPAAVQERAVSPGPGASAGGAGAGVDRQPQPRDAQGPRPAAAAAVHAELRRAAGGRRRRQDELPRTRPRGAAGPGSGAPLMDRHTLLLFAGIGALLLIASLIGFLLKRRAAEPSPTIDNLNARIAAWWVMVLVIGGAFLLGHVAVTLLF